MKKTKIDKKQYDLMGNAIDNLMRPKPIKIDPIPDVFVKIGDPLDHQRFGKGKVIEVDGGTCVVEFESGEIKHLLSKFAGFKL